MLNAAAHDKTIAGARVKSSISGSDAQKAGHDINHLVVRMAVRRAHPPILHAMFDERKFIAVRAHSALKTRFGKRGIHRVAGHESYVTHGFTISGITDVSLLLRQRGTVARFR